MEVQEKIIEWAKDRNLIQGSCPLSQKKKLLEEIEEFYVEVVNGTLEDTKLEFGDALVVMTIIAKQLEITFEECLELAYEKIKDRKGRMIDGVFVKEKDLPENQTHWTTSVVNFYE